MKSVIPSPIFFTNRDLLPNRRSSTSVLAIALAVCYSLRYVYWIPCAGSANICSSSDGRVFLWRFGRGTRAFNDTIHGLAADWRRPCSTVHAIALIASACGCDVQDVYPAVRLELDTAAQALLLFVFVEGIVLFSAFALVVALLAQAQRLSLLRRAVSRLFAWQALTLLVMIVLVVLLVRLLRALPSVACVFLLVVTLLSIFLSPIIL